MLDHAARDLDADLITYLEPLAAPVVLAVREDHLDLEQYYIDDCPRSTIIYMYTCIYMYMILLVNVNMQSFFTT